MKLEKWIKVIVIGASIVTLAACSSHKYRDRAAINDANSSYSSDDAQSSGLGDESNFGGQEGNTGKRTVAERTYYFDFDSSNVRDTDKPAISTNAQRLASTQKSKAMLEGNTDPRGSREYNIGLGERRAKSVAELMIAKGVNPSQVRVVSYGAEKLAAQGHSETDYQKDRRVDLVYTN